MGKKGNLSKSVESETWQWTEKTDPSISDEEVRISYRLALPKCMKCRKNCIGNPNCLYGLGEAYWTNYVTNLEDDKNQLEKIKDEINSQRRLDGEMVGLRNLGATCYVNTYLQLWFHNVEFRNAIYALSEKDEFKNFPNTLCSQLQVIFGLLQDSSSKLVDPTPFINCLGLSTDLQQDAQEFSKLFMCLLETTPGLSDVIQDQFSGNYAYVTRCLTCGVVTETSAKFYELDLNIQGHKDLKSCIKEFLKEEQLLGDNQYFCCACNSKQDAVRQIVLKRLPKTLSIQLLRFVFDRATLCRHKISTNLSFPDKLDFSCFLENSDASEISSDNEYYLSAVLLHRGPSASSGHFITHILDPSSGYWYKFNDEVVVKLKSGRKIDLDCCKEENEIWKDVHGEPTLKKPKVSKGTYLSKDVYMLVYSKKQFIFENQSQPKVPEHVQALVDDINFKFEVKLTDAQLTAQKEQETKHGYVKQVNEFLDILHSSSEAYEWVPTAVLKMFLNPDKGKKKNVHDIKNILCLHGNLSLEKLGLMKYIPKQAADLIFLGQENVERIPDSMMCYQCVQNKCLFLQSKRKLNEDFSIVTQALKSFQHNLLSETNECYYVGRMTLRKWKNIALQNICRKYQPKSVDANQSNGADISSDLLQEYSDAEDQFVFNSEVLCKHGNLTIEVSEMLVVPLVVWEILCYYYPNNRAFKLSASTPCSICTTEAEQYDKELTLRKTLAQTQKASLTQLYANKNRPTFERLKSSISNTKPLTEHFFVVSESFISNWRDFVRHPDKNEPVEDINNNVFLCPHGKLIYDVLSSLYYNDINKDVCMPSHVFLWKEEWDFIATHFNVDCSIFVQRIVTSPCSVVLQKISNKPEDKKMEKILESESSSENELPCALIHSHNKSPEKSIPHLSVDLVCTPDICKECMAYKAIEDQKRLCVYNNAEIYILKSTKSIDEIFQHNLNNCNTGISLLRRKSRSRRCTRGEKKLTGISSDMTLKELKVKIMMLFSVPPFDQKLWLNGEMLAADDATIGSLLIVPGCTIILIEDLPNQNDVPLIFETTPAEPEVGFKGTGLLGNL